MIGFFIDASFNHKSFWDFVKEDSAFSTVHKVVVYRWFVPCILLAYLITPLVDRVLFHRKEKSLYRFLCLLVVMELVTICFWNSSAALMILIRIPLYVAGYYFGSDGIHLCEEKPKWLYALYAATIVIGGCVIVLLRMKYGDIIMAEYGIWWYPWLVMAFPMCELVACFFDVLKRVGWLKWIANTFAFIGSISLEVYLWQWLITGYMVICLGDYVSRTLLCWLFVPVSIIVAWIYSLLFNRRRVNKNVKV